MRYIMKSGVLYKDTSNEVLAKMKSAVIGPEKKIYSNNDAMVLKTDIRYPDPQKEHSGDVRNKEYIMEDNLGNVIAVGKPGYAQGDDPDVVGWPVCRLPRVDHAIMFIGENQYLLIMHNSQNYCNRDEKDYEILRILHRGITGGWSIEDDYGFSPEIICGIFAFCRYIEQENEFLIV